MKMMLKKNILRHITKILYNKMTNKRLKRTKINREINIWLKYGKKYIRIKTYSTIILMKTKYPSQ